VARHMRLDRARYPYAACYCEENVWHLCRRPEFRKSYVVFISNGNRSVPLWAQQKCHGDLPVIWDYHVVCICAKDGVFRVFDHDSSLDWGAPFATYTARTFGPAIRALLDRSLNQEKPSLQLLQYLPCFRVVASERYLRNFASDRSHMRQGNRWLAPPPPWPAIQAENRCVSNNLPEYWAVEHPWQHGGVITSVDERAPISADMLARRAECLEELHASDMGAIFTLQTMLELFGS